MKKDKAKLTMLITAGLLGLMAVGASVMIFRHYALIVLAGLIIWSVVVENSWLRVRRLAVHNPKIKQPVRLLQISDFHANGWVLGQIQQTIARECPDVIVLTGDIFDAEKTNNQPAYDLMRYLAELDLPVLLIYGNHETAYPTFWRQVQRSLPAQIQPLNHQSRQITPEFDCFGADYGNKKFLCKLNDKRFNLLLTHTPRDAEKYAQRYAFDLILCGHEHGGQVRLPLIGAVLSAGAQLFTEWRGHRTRGVFTSNHSMIYIDSGAGSSTLPVRLFCPVQVTVIDIHGNA